MKKFIIFFAILLSSCHLNAQDGYEFALIHVSNNNFKIVAVPNFDASGDTDVSNIGFTLMLPAGNFDVTNTVSHLPSRTWVVQQYDATTLSGIGVGDGTRDAFLITLPPGQTLISHNTNDQIDLMSFTISEVPNSGTVSFLHNTDPINIALGNVLDSFYQANIDNTSTQNYFLGFVTGLDSFLLSTLSTPDVSEIRLDIYPNPVSDAVYVKGPSIISYQIFDLLGRLVTKGSYNSETGIKVDNIASAEYVIQLKTDNDQVISKKLIVKH